MAKFRRLYFDPTTAQYHALLIGQNIDSLVFEDSFETSPYVINHNKDTDNIVVSVFDENDGEIIPDRVHLLDSNTTEVYFAQPFVGKIHITFF